MLSILWIIIKIILIILLCILGILLAGILIVLLVPLRYGAQLSWLEQKANGSVKISWLFRIVMFCMEVKDNQISTKVLLFGRDFKKGRTSRKRSLPENAAAERRTRGDQAEKKEKIVPSKEMIPEEEVPEQTKAVLIVFIVIQLHPPIPLHLSAFYFIPYCLNVFPDADEHLL